MGPVGLVADFQQCPSNGQALLRAEALEVRHVLQTGPGRELQLCVNRYICIYKFIRIHMEKLCLIDFYTYVHLYVYIYVCVLSSIHTCMYVCTYTAYIYIYTYLYECLNICRNTCIYLSKCICVCTRTYIHVYVYVYMYMYM